MYCDIIAVVLRRCVSSRSTLGSCVCVCAQNEGNNVPVSRLVNNVVDTDRHLLCRDQGFSPSFERERIKDHRAYVFLFCFLE